MTVILRGRNGNCDTMLNVNITEGAFNCGCNVFIPNAFSPFTSQTINDVFHPYGSDCAKSVLLMEIFDRWGERVYSKTNFPLNDDTYGWNGIFKSKELQPAVYVYRIDILYNDGTIKQFSGDVTLVR